MSDSYRAIYDAASERLDISWARDMVRDEFMRVAYEQMRPCILLRPKLYPDGDQWCALYGEDLQMGVAGFGDTPEAAMRQFDIEYLNARAGVAAKARA